MERLLSSQGMLVFRKPVPTFREHAELYMIALTARRRKRVVNTEETVPEDPI